MRSSTGRPGGRMIVLLAIPFLVWASCGGDDSFTPSPNPVCALSPDTLDFGTVTIGGHRDLTFTVRNIGTVALNGTIAESCSQYSIVSGGGAFSLGVGDSVVATVRYEPADAGTHACAIATGTIACGSVSCTGEAHSGWEQVYSNAYQGWFDIWGTSASDIWAVGYDIIHFDGIDWTVTTNPSDKRLYGVWGTGPDNVYAVGHDYFTNDGVILRYNGTGWSIVQDDIQDLGFLGVWGSGASDIYAVGLGGNAYHYNGSSWGSFLLGGVVTHAVWGTAANDVFVVGDTGRILERFDEQHIVRAPRRLGAVRLRSVRHLVRLADPRLQRLHLAVDAERRNRIAHGGHLGDRGERHLLRRVRRNDHAFRRHELEGHGQPDDAGAPRNLGIFRLERVRRRRRRRDPALHGAVNSSARRDHAPARIEGR
jgi:hypothetical protein